MLKIIILSPIKYLDYLWKKHHVEIILSETSGKLVCHENIKFWHIQVSYFLTNVKNVRGFTQNEDYNS